MVAAARLAAAVGVFIPLVIGLNPFQLQVGIDALLWPSSRSG